jgi:hypothetical protein
LLLADLFSLWLCCDAPIAGESSELLEQSPMKLRTEKLLAQFEFKTVGFGRRHPTPDNRVEALAWIIAVDPFPFATSPLTLATTADLVPVERYSSWPELKAASRRIEVRWRLIPPGPPSA